MTRAVAKQPRSQAPVSWAGVIFGCHVTPPTQHQVNMMKRAMMKPWARMKGRGPANQNAATLIHSCTLPARPASHIKPVAVELSTEPSHVILQV